MHAQQFAPHHQNFYPAFQSMNPAINSGQYLATHNNFNLGGFSRGSPLRYADHQYHFLPDRGGPSTRISSSVARTGLNATGTGISDTPTQAINVFRAEGIANYQQPWQWTPTTVHGHAAPMSAPLDPNLSSFKSATMNPAGVVRSPAAQLPTPAAMAVLLNPNAQSKITLPRPPPMTMPRAADGARQPASTRPTHQEPGVGTQSMTDSFLREKKHACTMCHKRSVRILFLFTIKKLWTHRLFNDRFDRPSTLRKASAPGKPVL
jgi:hypothetical protein